MAFTLSLLSQSPTDKGDLVDLEENNLDDVKFLVHQKEWMKGIIMILSNMLLLKGSQIHWAVAPFHVSG